MDETLISFLTAILIAGVVVFLRLHRKLREAYEETAAIKKMVAIHEQRSVQLKEAQKQAEAKARKLRFFKERPPRVNARVAPALSPAYRPELSEYLLLLLTDKQREFAEVRDQLDVLYAEARHLPQESHIAEFDCIVDHLERATGCNLSRWLGIPPQNEQAAGQLTKVSIGQLQARDSKLFSTGILSLRAFCSYQIEHSQLPKGFVLPPPKAGSLLH